MKQFDISLYGILDPDHCNGRDLAALAEVAVTNGVTLLQYRSKQPSTRKMIDEVGKILDVLDKYDVPLIINDRVDVALVCSADGVHLGQSDMHPSDARKLLGEEKIIGLSIKTLDDAEQAPIELIDYAFIGGVFETNTKDNPPGIGISGWKERADILKASNPDLPIGAIAGIDNTNVSELIQNGVEGVALISHLFKAEDVAKSCSDMAERINEARGII